MASNEMEKVVVFKLDNEEFGVSIHQVKSIEKMQTLTKVPKLKDFVRGVLNLRGTVIPIIDLRFHLFQTKIEDSDDTRIIVVEVDTLDIGFIVDAATDVIDIAEDSVQELSMSNEAIKNGLKIAKLEEQLITLLDLSSLLKDMDPAETLKNIKNAVQEVNV